MKYITLILFMISAANAGDRVTLRLKSKGKGKGWIIRPELYKGGSTEIVYHTHVYTTFNDLPILKCTKSTLSKGATYILSETITRNPKSYGVEVFTKGKRIYSRLKGKSVKKFAHDCKCEH